MKIAVDVSPVVYGTGVSVYTESLVKNLLKIDNKNDYILFGGSLRRSKELKKFTDGLKGRFTSKIFPIPPTLADFIWNRLHLLTIDRLIGKIDVFHSSDWTQPPTKAFKVTTIHDLYPFKFPKFTDPKIRSVHEARLKLVAKEIDRIIVPSEATKVDLVGLGFDENIVRVIFEAPRAEFSLKTKEEVESAKLKYKIPGKYLVSIGIGGRKNTDNLIKAFELAKAGENLTLLLVGRPQGPVEEARGIRYVGHLGNEELAVLYSGAEALVYPSLYEGFGLPILEAMKCGCPVVTSNISSMPEVAGNAAVLVDPYKIESIVDGIKMALRHKQLYKGRGLVRVHKFSWEKAARETLAVYSESKS